MVFIHVFHHFSHAPNSLFRKTIYTNWINTFSIQNHTFNKYIRWQSYEPHREHACLCLHYFHTTFSLTLFLFTDFTLFSIAGSPPTPTGTLAWPPLGPVLHLDGKAILQASQPLQVFHFALNRLFVLARDSPLPVSLLEAEGGHRVFLRAPRQTPLAWLPHTELQAAGSVMQGGNARLTLDGIVQFFVRHLRKTHFLLWILLKVKANHILDDTTRYSLTSVFRREMKLKSRKEAISYRHHVANTCIPRHLNRKRQWPCVCVCVCMCVECNIANCWV